MVTVVVGLSTAQLVLLELVTHASVLQCFQGVYSARRCHGNHLMMYALRTVLHVNYLRLASLAVAAVLSMIDRSSSCSKCPSFLT